MTRKRNSDARPLSPPRSIVDAAVRLLRPHVDIAAPPAPATCRPRPEPVLTRRHGCARPLTPPLRLFRLRAARARSRCSSG
ncbi:Os08g0431400 [Oryza sativa Japonica Group]|uniref:Os08g0431400 protein n=1 Tax=Oryza sativa subsp. japonica TaxID=39947 RepID=A0A0P0XG29_ORYSJ|nr:Os08g0431400 [Oryza sativa Japonica Group]